jgi:hypothetical protein
MHSWERQQKGPQAWPFVDRPYITLLRPLGKIVLLVAVRNDAFDLISSSLFLTTARQSTFGAQAYFPNQNPKFRSRGPPMPLRLPFALLPRVCPMRQPYLARAAPLTAIWPTMLVDISSNPPLCQVTMVSLRAVE